MREFIAKILWSLGIGIDYMLDENHMPEFVQKLIDKERRQIEKEIKEKGFFNIDFSS